MIGGANQARSSGPLAESAKNGRPIETANRPSSHSAAVASVGGCPHQGAIASGRNSVAAAITATCSMTERLPGR